MLFTVRAPSTEKNISDLDSFLVRGARSGPCLDWKVFSYPDPNSRLVKRPQIRATCLVDWEWYFSSNKILSIYPWTNKLCFWRERLIKSVVASKLIKVTPERRNQTMTECLSSPWKRCVICSPHSLSASNMTFCWFKSSRHIICWIWLTTKNRTRRKNEKEKSKLIY